MQKVSNEQLVTALLSFRWKTPSAGSAFDQLLRRRSRIIGGSQLSEDLIGTMKNTRSISNHTLVQKARSLVPQFIEVQGFG